MRAVIHGIDDTTAAEVCKEPCSIRKTWDAGPMETSTADGADIEDIVRARLRSLRHSLGWSLDDLAERSHLSASTISRIETGKRNIGLDVLTALARALHVDVNSLLDVDRDDTDVVIRPLPTGGWPGATVWPLSRPTSATAAIKVRLEPGARRNHPQVHPGHDWLFVLSGRVRLTLGEREVTVEAGEAAEFSTMTPHAIDALDTLAEIIMVFDRDGQRAHLHRHAE
jgi:transcriptional regulator with XRE-family HTH domain